jgi:phosphatidylinositol alpha-1,6-mannosyltransferase
MKKVLFITRKWPPSVGGMETYSVELTEELKKIIELKIYPLEGNKDGSPPAFFFITLFIFKSILQCFKFRMVDAIHLGDMVLWPLAIFCRLFNHNLSLVISAHGTDVAYPLRRGFLPFLYGKYLALGALVMNSHIKVVANSHATAAYCRSYGFNNVYVVPLGVKQRLITNNTHSLKSNYILFVGRLAQRKGLGWFVHNVLPQLPDNISLKVAGTKWDANELMAINSSPRTKYLGPIYGEELAALRRNAIAVIMPNINCGGRDFEGFGLTAVEAAADGAILIASGIDGIVDAVIDGKSGWLLPSADAAAWKNKIIEIINWDSNRRSDFVNDARETIKKHYSWERTAHDTLEIYNQIVTTSDKSLF